MMPVISANGSVDACSQQKKTKKKILSGLSHEIVSQSTSEGLENLYANYQVSFPEELENVIYDNLEIEYDYVCLLYTSRCV